MDKIITTPCGQIKGYDCRISGVTAFKGIRYAIADRWEYPKQVTKWDGIYDAKNYGNCSYQPRSFYNEEENLKKIFYYNEFRRGENYTYSEDCLFLNVWTPDDATPDSKHPVIVYIHGGGFTGGCGHEKHFHDPIWPTKGVVAVTINYRLGPMGFFCLPELKEKDGNTGNYGLYDQLTALKWVKDNISAFGGDPEQVTIMGQSAGAMSVQILCQTPLSDGLFNAAVMSSGCGMTNMLMGSVEKSGSFWQEFMHSLGCNNVDELRRIEPDKLFAHWQTAKKEIKGGMMATFPVCDGEMVSKDFSPKNIPYIVGSNSHDMAPPILASLARKWGKKLGHTNYVYMFDRMLPGDDNGAWHSSDLWYWFGTLDNSWRPFEDQDYDLSDKMTTMLCNFAKNHTPNGENTPEWKDNSRGKKVLCLGEGGIRMEKPSTIKLTITMLTNKAVGE